jgi:protein gp37
MSKNSKIEWCDHTFNPWEGCQQIGPGCDNCYAEARNARFGGGTAVNWGPGAPRRRTSTANWCNPLAWDREHAEFFAEHGRRQRVFCASLADVFDNEVPTAWRQDLFDLILATPHLDWLLLTKRIGNASRMLQDISEQRGTMMDANDRYRPLPNVWIGATVVNQEEADRDIPKLLAVPAHRRFLSMEPLLGSVDLTPAYLPCPNAVDSLMMDPETGAYECCSRCDFTGIGNEMGIDWVIVGGESGKNGRPMHPQWARDIRDQCAGAGVPFLFKQWGEWAPTTAKPIRGEYTGGGIFMHPNGYWGCQGDWWDGKAEAMDKVGKRGAGRLLDGVTHDGYPDGGRDGG